MMEVIAFSLSALVAAVPSMDADPGLHARNSEQPVAVAELRQEGSGDSAGTVIFNDEGGSIVAAIEVSGADPNSELSLSLHLGSCSEEGPVRADLGTFASSEGGSVSGSAAVPIGGEELLSMPSSVRARSGEEAFACGNLTPVGGVMERMPAPLPEPAPEPMPEPMPEPTPLPEPMPDPTPEPDPFPEAVPGPMQD